MTDSWCIVGTVRWSIHKLIPVGIVGVGYSRRCPSTALLNPCQGRRGWVRLLATKVRLLGRVVDVAVKSTFQVGLLAKFKVQEVVIELVVQVGERLSRPR